METEMGPKPAQHPLTALLFDSKALPERRKSSANSKVARMINSISWRQKYAHEEFHIIELGSKDPPVELKIKQLKQGELTGFGTGAAVWPAAVVLAKYIEKHQAANHIRICELGAGTGIVGLACAVTASLAEEAPQSTDNNADAEVVLTDLPHLIPLLNENILRCEQECGTPPGRARAMAYAWGAPLPAALRRRRPSAPGGQEGEGRLGGGGGGSGGGGGGDGGPAPFDLVLVSDCVLPRLYPLAPLADALALLLPPTHAAATATAAARGEFASADHQAAGEGPSPPAPPPGGGKEGEAAAAAGAVGPPPLPPPPSPLEERAVTEEGRRRRRRSARRPPRALMSYEYRYYEEYDAAEEFEKLLNERGLVKRIIPRSEYDLVYSTEDIEIWEVLREESNTENDGAYLPPSHYEILAQEGQSEQTELCITFPLGLGCQTIRIPRQVEALGTGSNLWPSALEMAAKLSPLLLGTKGLRVLELGSGRGALAALAAALGHAVLATDRAALRGALQVAGTMNESAIAGAGGRLKFDTYAWGDPLPESWGGSWLTSYHQSEEIQGTIKNDQNTSGVTDGSGFDLVLVADGLIGGDSAVPLLASLEKLVYGEEQAPEENGKDQQSRDGIISISEIDEQQEDKRERGTHLPVHKCNQFPIIFIANEYRSALDKFLRIANRSFNVIQDPDLNDIPVKTNNQQLQSLVLKEPLPKRSISWRYEGDEPSFSSHMVGFYALLPKLQAKKLVIAV